ncbi:MAG: hypothetical protein ACKODT_07985 [Fluviibacter sp.]
MIQGTTDLIAAVIRNHVEWYQKIEAASLAAEIFEAVYAKPCPAADLDDSDIEAVRRIVFPTQTHPEDIEWGCETVESCVRTAEILRHRK